MVATELGLVYVEVETHGVEAITMQASDASIQQGKSMSGEAVSAADRF